MKTIIHTGLSKNCFHRDAAISKLHFGTRAPGNHAQLALAAQLKTRKAIRLKNTTIQTNSRNPPPSPLPGNKPRCGNDMPRPLSARGGRGRGSLSLARSRPGTSPRSSNP